MFQGIVNRAQHSVELLVGRLLTKVAVAVPFLLATIFAVIAATIWLTQIYGSMFAYLIMAGLFAVIGILVAIFSALGAAETQPAKSEATVEQNSAEPDVESIVSSALNNQDILLAMLGTAGPAILPTLMRMLAKNWPLVVGAIIIIYFMFADTKPTARDNTAPEPAM